MKEPVAIIGAGVSGLTCAVTLAEHGHDATIFSDEPSHETTSAAAAAIWYPYDAEPMDKVISWALKTYEVLVPLAQDRQTGVSMIEFRTFSRDGEIRIPAWAHNLEARKLKRTELLAPFTDGFALRVPLMDTTLYLDYLGDRFRKAGGHIPNAVHFEQLDDVDREYRLVINCTGIGARVLVPDRDLDPHRGQVVSIPKLENLKYAIASDDPPLMYAIPRRNDCILGGSNKSSSDRRIDQAITSQITAECSRVLHLHNPKIIGARVGLRPFRKSGVRLERELLHDGRVVIHNYGHGGSGFTLSWGCAQQMLRLVENFS